MDEGLNSIIAHNRLIPKTRKSLACFALMPTTLSNFLKNKSSPEKKNDLLQGYHNAATPKWKHKLYQQKWKNDSCNYGNKRNSSVTYTKKPN